ncbi:ubiquitin carboxyl-terminal hydrolase 8, partial [Lasius niger]
MLGLYYLEWIQEDMHSYKLYTHRSEIYVDIIILLDWDTTQKSLTSINGLYILKDLLENWDRGTVYKKIKILNGGYQEWLARYPAFATNPSVDETEVE